MRVGESATYFSRPTPTTSPFANGSMLAPCPVVLATANLYSLLQYIVLAISRKAEQLAILRPHRGEAMWDREYYLRSIHLLRGWVNNANPSVRIYQNPKGWRNGRKRNRSLPMPGHSHRSDRGRIGHSSPQAGEFLLK